MVCTAGWPVYVGWFPGRSSTCPFFRVGGSPHPFSTGGHVLQTLFPKPSDGGTSHTAETLLLVSDALSVEPVGRELDRQEMMLWALACALFSIFIFGVASLQYYRWVPLNPNKQHQANSNFANFELSLQNSCGDTTGSNRLKVTPFTVFVFSCAASHLTVWCLSGAVILGYPSWSFWSSKQKKELSGLGSPLEVVMKVHLGQQGKGFFVRFKFLCTRGETLPWAT